MKFLAARGGLMKDEVNDLISLAQNEARGWYDMGILPPSSGNSGVLCSKRVSLHRVWSVLSFCLFESSVSGVVDAYTNGTNSPLIPPSPHTSITPRHRIIIGRLHAVLRGHPPTRHRPGGGARPLPNLKVVVNPGNGAGCFVVDVSIHHARSGCRIPRRERWSTR
jgi:hypothetical protein